MQIKLEMVFSNLDEDHIINVPDGSDFLGVFAAITKAMRDECIYEDEIKSISFDAEGRLRLRHLLSGDPS